MTRDDQDSTVIGAAGAVVLATYGLQLHTVPALKQAALAAGFGGGRRPGASDALTLLGDAAGFVDAVTCLLLAAGLVGLAVAELRGRRVSRFVRAALAETGRPLPLLALVTALALRTSFDPGLPHGFDAKQHMAKVFAVTDQIGDGQWPGWTWRWYGGFPLLRFYGPLSYLVAGVLGQLGGAVLGVKLYLALCHALSGVAAFRFVRTATGSQSAATLATVVYLLAIPRFHTLFALGRLPEAALWALLPALLALVETFVRDRRWTTAACAGTTLAALLLSHPVLGAVCGVLAATWAGLRLALTGGLRAAFGQTLLYGATTGAIAVGLALWWLVPATRERPFVQIDHLYGGGTPSLIPTTFDPKDVVDFLRWRGPARGASPLGYLGFTVLGLAAWGGVRHARSRAALVVPGAVLLGVGVAYACGGYFLARGGAYLMPFLALLAGLSVVGDRAAAPRRVVLAVSLVLLELLPLTVRAPFRPDLHGVERDLAALADRLDGRRAVIASVRGGRIETAQWTGWDGRGPAVLGGPFREGASALYPWEMALLGRVGDELAAAGPLSPSTVAALRLFGVGAVVVEDGSGMVVPSLAPGPGYRVDAELRAVVLDGDGPFVVAGTERPLDDTSWKAVTALPGLRLTDLPDDRDRVVAGDALDALTRTARDGVPMALPAPPGATTSTDGDDVPATYRVRRVSVTHHTVALALDVDSDAVLWLPFARLPGVTVRQNGELLDLGDPPGNADPWPFLTVPLAAGAHEVVLDGPAGPRSGGWGYVSLATLLLAAGLWWTTRRRAAAEL